MSKAGQTVGQMRSRTSGESARSLQWFFASALLQLMQARQWSRPVGLATVRPRNQRQRRRDYRRVGKAVPR